jgi:hypothetical protein
VRFWEGKDDLTITPKAKGI